MILALLLLTLCLHAVDCPRWLTRIGVVKCREAPTRPRSPAPYRTHPVPMAVGKAEVPAKAPPPPPPGGAQDPDPWPSRRVSIRPQPTRAPRDEAMALGPLRGGGGGLARAMATGPKLNWGCGGVAGGTGAAALRLPLAPVATGTAAGDPPPSPPSPPPRGAKESEGLTGDVDCLTREQEERGRQQLKAPKGPHRGLPATAPEPTEALDVTLCLHAAARPRRLTMAWAVNCGGGGGNTTALSGALPDTPGAGDGGDGSGTSPGDPPPGEAPGSGSPARQEGVYTLIIYEGAPERGDGTESPPGEGTSPSNGKGPHGEVGEWRYGRGHSRHAPRLPLAPDVTGMATGDPPPYPPPWNEGVRGADRSRALPDREARGAGDAPAKGAGGPTP